MRVLLVLFVLGASPAQAQLAGQYAVTGTNLDGSPYEGTLTVSPAGFVHQFSWRTGNDYEGVALTGGIAGGNAVAVAFGGEGCGVALYDVFSNAHTGAAVELAGIWSLFGSDEIASELARRERVLINEEWNGFPDVSGVVNDTTGTGLAHTYTVYGVNFDSSEYTGALRIDTAGPVFVMTWTTGAEVTGVGIRVGEQLAASYGGPECGLAAYRLEPDGTLTGTWTMNGAVAVGTERAVRM